MTTAASESAVGRFVVLLVEDHEDTRLMYAMYLRGEGFEVVDDATPATAFDRALELQPDVVVTDYVMAPVTGVQLCEQLRAHPSTCRIPVVMVTAHTAPRDVELFSTLCAAVLVKPIMPDKLAIELVRVIKENRGSAERP